MKNTNRYLKGSYTLEAALLSGCILFSVCFVLFLFLGVEKRSYGNMKALEAASAAAALSVRSTGNGTEAANRIVREENSFFSVSDSGKEIIVIFENSVRIPFGSLKWDIQGEGRAKIIKPVPFIEKVKKARRWKEVIRS